MICWSNILVIYLQVYTNLCYIENQVFLMRCLFPGSAGSVGKSDGAVTRSNDYSYNGYEDFRSEDRYIQVRPRFVLDDQYQSPPLVGLKKKHWVLDGSHLKVLASSDWMYQ